MALRTGGAVAQVALPEVVVTAPSPILSRQGGSSPWAEPLPGVLPVVTDQFATVTVVPSAEIQRNGGATLGDLLFLKPGITGSSFAPGASSRPIVRGLDVNRIRIQEDGVGANGASDLGEDHFVPVDPLTVDRVEVIRGPATLRYGSQAIGGVVETLNNRIPTVVPPSSVTTEFRGGASSASDGLDGAVLLDAAGGNFAFHADAFGRHTSDYRVPSYPYLVPPAPADAPGATRPGAFNGRQPNSSMQSDGQAIGGSYIFDGGFIGLALTHNDALYHIPGIDGEDHHTRIDAEQTKLLTKGEWRAPNATIDAIRFWGGITDYKHDELGWADDTDPTTDGVRQTFINREQEGRIETQLAPINLDFAALTTAIGVQGGHQYLDAPSPDGAGLWDPNTNWRIASYIFNEFKFSATTKAQVAGRIEHVGLSGMGRSFDALGTMTTASASPAYTPKSASIGLIQDLPWDLVASVTAQYVERAPKPAELFSGGVHDATVTFDKGNVNLGIEAARSVEVALKRATGPFRFEANAYYTRFNGFIYRRLTGNTCDEDTNVCGPGAGEVNEAIYSQSNATFRGAEFQSQLDLLPLNGGIFGIEDQFDIVRATFDNGTNVPRIPPMRIGGGVYWRDPSWLIRVNLVHAFDQTDVAPVAETPTVGYDDLRAEISYRWKPRAPMGGTPTEMTIGLVGTNLLNDDIRNAVSYSKDEVLMPGASVRAFASIRF